MSERIILVTGGLGFIGSHIVDKLVDQGFKVRIIDNLSSGRMENIEHRLGDPRLEVLNIDLKDKDKLVEYTKDVEVVFHYAANPEVRVSTTDPEIHFKENILATFNLLEAMRVNDVEELVFASSSSVYGEPEFIPVDENASVKPVSVYGASKAACENLIQAYSNLYGFKTVSLRYANVVGPRLRHGVIYDFITKLLANPRRLEILGDGSQTRSYIYIDDAVEATITVWRSIGRGFDVYNVGSGDWINVREIADIIVEVMKLENVEYIYKPILHGIGWLGDVKHIALKIDKVRKLGWKPKLDSRGAVREAARRILEEVGGRHLETSR
ncbi:MAG: NAD-dependent epimerase/dehydratase family protein [Candidatus Bathyarchaeia archaeon]|nr:NAD-dependent epimerase/dehydratase family protein [Candidatus Bathyarchaeota archaeon]